VAGLPVPFHQRVPDEQLPRRRRVDAPVRDLSVHHQGHPYSVTFSSATARRVSSPSAARCSCAGPGAAPAAPPTPARSGPPSAPTTGTSPPARPPRSSPAPSWSGPTRGRSRTWRCARRGTRPAGGVQPAPRPPRGPAPSSCRSGRAGRPGARRATRSVRPTLNGRPPPDRRPGFATGPAGPAIRGPAGSSGTRRGTAGGRPRRTARAAVRSGSPTGSGR